MRRSIDILLSFLALVCLSPLLLAVAVVVVLDSPGGPFYLASRVGRHGRLFRMWKFRTMVAGAATAGSVTGRNDSRITRSGRFLRKTKIDELPQFLNVLCGDMTLVGPRPETPDMVVRYTESQRAVLHVKPGITGRVQLEVGEESEGIPEGMQPDEYYVNHLLGPKLQLDLEYLRVRTPLSDARILLRTAGFVLRALALRAAPRVPSERQLQ